MIQVPEDAFREKEVYRLLNRIILLAGCVLCVLIILAHRYQWGVCGLRTLYVRECILCGCTRDFFALLNGNTSFLNPCSIVIFGFLFLQLCFRTMMSLFRVVRCVWIADAIVTGGFLLGFEIANFKVICDAIQ